MRLRLLAVTFGLALLPSVAAAQHEGHGTPTKEQLGLVKFENSCSAAVAADFNRAVALLHSFEFRPASDAFSRVLERDASCAIAYWGLAMCQWGNPFAGIKSGPLLERGSAAVQKGLATGSPTPRERGFVEAAAALYRDHQTVPHRDRTVAYESAMEKLAG